MHKEKPKDIEEYAAWLGDAHGVSISDRTQTYYEAVVSKVMAEFISGPLWHGLRTDLDQVNQAYFTRTNYYLLIRNALPELCTKPFDSFLLKTFRYNVLANGEWPKPPDGGWMLPADWFSRVNDLVRTCFVVKYLDGVDTLAGELSNRCRALGLDCRLDYEAKEEGYYAAHFYVLFPCEIPRHDWDTEDATFSVEIQITTQLQEVIRALLHKYYERRRVRSPDSEVTWQWDYRSDEFAANYLGHILHYVEGMIMDVRDRKIGGDPTDGD